MKACCRLSALLDVPLVQAAQNVVPVAVTAAESALIVQLARNTKSRSPEQRSQAAESFGAEGEFLSAGKKLIDTRHPRFRAVNAIRGTALQFFKASSLAFPEPAVRLLRRDDVEGVVARLTALQELAEAVAELDIDSQLKAARSGGWDHCTTRPITPRRSQMSSP